MQTCFISENWNDKAKISPCLWWSQRASPHQFLRSLLKEEWNIKPSLESPRFQACRMSHPQRMLISQIQAWQWAVSKQLCDCSAVWAHDPFCSPLLHGTLVCSCLLLLPSPALLLFSWNLTSSLFFLAHEWPLKQRLLVLICWSEGPRSQ